MPAVGRLWPSDYDDGDEEEEEEDEDEDEVLIRGEWGEDEAMAALRSLTRPPLTPHNPNSALRLQSVVSKCLLYHIIARTLQKVLRDLSELS